MPTEKRVPSLIVNTLTQAQYEALENPSDTEMWVTPYDKSILPSQSGQSGKFLTTDGTDASWAEIPTDVDNKSVSLNSNDEIQTVGVIDQNDTTKAIKIWTGIRARFDAIATKDADTIYNITDDTVLADFANTSLSNLTNAGKIVGAGLGMPSSTYIDLTLGASGTIYTAPANGWLYLQKEYEADKQIDLYNLTSGTGMIMSAASANYSLRAMTPCFKGDRVMVNYSASSAVQTFRFVYAEGSKSEAN